MISITNGTIVGFKLERSGSQVSAVEFIYSDESIILLTAAEIRNQVGRIVELYHTKT